MLHAMNYRHAFHAGNHADVLKHIVLLALVDALKRKDTPFFVLDTHAGRGRYLLGGAESRKTSEADEGVSRLLDAPRLPALAEAYLRAVQANNPVGALVAYPGSPLLVAQAMRWRPNSASTANSRSSSARGASDVSTSATALTKSGWSCRPHAGVR